MKKTPVATHATPLLGLLRAMTKDEQEAFASAVGTTRVYLYQLAAQKEPNPRLRLSLAIVKESQRLNKKFMSPILRLEDLLIGPP